MKFKSSKNKILLAGFTAFLWGAAAAPGLANSTTDLLTQPNVALEIVKPNGQKLLLFLNKNGTYTTSGPAKGTWTITGDEFCVTRNANSNHDGRGGIKTCGTVLNGKTVGFSWTVPSNTKGDTHYTIVNASRK